eukprot:TRINITY_DN62981_c0_g1_i1.p1 TRINITY_DN62981_c0_g1~~TRINITY_DN62981_c0_g1_i1.p1  ORF type:complete len:231 (-),score=35.97 TRINITY_DN62981_c0_g1_i1:340-1032(-)
MKPSSSGKETSVIGQPPRSSPEDSGSVMAAMVRLATKSKESAVLSAEVKWLRDELSSAEACRLAVAQRLQTARRAVEILHARSELGQANHKEMRERFESEIKILRAQLAQGNTTARRMSCEEDDDATFGFFAGRLVVCPSSSKASTFLGSKDLAKERRILCEQKQSPHTVTCGLRSADEDDTMFCDGAGHLRESPTIALPTVRVVSHRALCPPQHTAFEVKEDVCLRSSE